ncbi:MAG TPA: RNA methyltransferase [Acidobacteriota bacterium]|nr:RNA methyltransferase [Acidobacteriota bacterium]
MQIRHVTSKSNQALKEFRRPAPAGEFALVEGPKLLLDALEAGVGFEHVAVEKGHIERHRELLEQCARAGADLISIPSNLLSGISDVVTSQGICALLRPQHITLAMLPLGGNPLLLVADGVQDPGNLGAMIRSAVAFGADALIALPGCADIWSAKTIRGSAGACFRLPSARAPTGDTFEFLRESKIQTFALDTSGQTKLGDSDLGGRCAIIVGSEGSGLSEEVVRAVEQTVRIPISETSESLNAAVAAAIALYAASIQRTRK